MNVWRRMEGTAFGIGWDEDELAKIMAIKLKGMAK